MRDVDCDFESIVVTRPEITTVEGTTLLGGAKDSPQAYVVPWYALQAQRNIACNIVPQNADLGKHGDTAVGEIQAMEALLLKEKTSTYDGAVLSRMMWDRAVAGQIDSIDGAKLQETIKVNDQITMPSFDHCQFDALQTNADKVESFYEALHNMDYNDPQQQPIMKLEGIQRSWAKPRQDGYNVVRAALGLSTNARRAQNFVPRGVRAFSSSTNHHALAMETGRSFLTARTQDAVSLTPGSRVGVIGCGVAGLQAIRSLRGRGYNVTAFDKAPDVGGLWRENYDSFLLQVGKQFFEMPDLEMTEAEWQELASGPKVQQYIMRFAREFDLNSAIQLKTEIESVKKKADGTWTFRTSSGKDEIFDFCVVATGMYSAYPFVPEVPGKDSFSGLILHTSQFLDAKVAHNKKVVVVGGGKSATDCSTSASEARAASVTMLQRNTHWPTPLYIAGLIPFQHIFLSRLGQALVEAKVGVYPGSKSITSVFHPIMGPIFSIVEELFAFQQGLKDSLRPRSGVVEDFYGYAQVQDNSFKAARDSGMVHVEAGEIEAFTEHCITVDVEEMEADMVVFATGFKKDYSTLFEQDVMEKLNVQDDGLYLYKRIVPPSVPALAFVGSECATIFNCTNSGLQAEWLARTLAGETKQVLRQESMLQEADSFRKFARSWMLKTPSRSSLVLLHQLHYYDQLLKDMGENPSQKTNPLAEYFGPYYSCDYNNIVGRPSQVSNGGADFSA